MMEAMGMLVIGRMGEPTLIGEQAPQQGREDKEEEESDLQQVMDHLDTLEVQVGVIDSNVEGIRHEVTMLNHNLMAYFQSQNFFPPLFPPQ